MSAMDGKVKDFEKALAELVSGDLRLALSAVTGCFVGLVIEVVRRNGEVPDGEIRIDGGAQRDITIHPPKKGNVDA